MGKTAKTAKGTREVRQMEDTLKIELLTPLTGTFLPNEMEQDWEGEEYHELEEEQVLFDGADLIPYVSEIVQPYRTHRLLSRMELRITLFL